MANSEDENVRGPLNGSAPEPLRNDRFTLELARALGKSVFLPVPESALKIALGEMSSTILASQRVIPKKAQALGFKFEHGEIVETLQSLAAPLRGGQHEIFSEQWLPLKPDALFPFYCDEKNLESLTPPFLKFRVLNKSTPAMNEGTLINYRLSLHGLPFKWQTRIEDWAPNKRFVDTQLKGPYKKWYHIHDFIPLGGGTLIRDRVTYKLPFGLFGDAFVGWKVSGDVEKIFAYRRDVIDEQFGEKVIKS
jgi:ligand-binding SRPBCC domain-containing protein